MGCVYTIGYEGRTAEEFLRELKGHKVKRLVDVRERAFSWKKGFSKTALSLALNGAGIEYVHMPALGSPAELRKELYKKGDYDCFFRDYAKHLAARGESLGQLKELAGSKASAIMCFERDPGKCHRSIIASELGQGTAEVLHL
ncbi:MAG: DUF488 domain-containing protein [Candidatus Diapherotrites archaeon]|nr:DUF488 domain-containing protein [Candidatus Micrarchaeota archaeon]MBU1939800.1 DUF488 domain-containing protein [Candidatus Micrarchaeota archaeon]